MRRALPALRLLQQAAAAGEGAAGSAVAGTRSLTTAFPSLTDAPPPAGSSAISLSAKADGKGVSVDVKVGRASAKTSYPAAAARTLGDSPLVLYDTPRISVLHASLMEYLLRVANERYQLLASWPDFTQLYGKDYYFRSHPEDVRKFYELVDEYHRMWDVVTEFDSLSGLASQLVPPYRKRRLNTVHPAASPTSANCVLTQFLLSQGATK